MQGQDNWVESKPKRGKDPLLESFSGKLKKSCARVQEKGNVKGKGSFLYKVDVLTKTKHSRTNSIETIRG